jgi:septin family protein
MTEEERLKVAKERIEFILKTYQVDMYYDYDDEECICIKGNTSMRVSIDYNV